MLPYESTAKPYIKVILGLVVFVLIAYLPVSSFQFCLKNDAFSGYFPPKFFMSEAIKQGMLPLWNPYINFGIPQYGDMSSGFWSPITWLIASTVGYNAYSFTIELLGYIVLGGVGMYKLLSIWQLQPIVKYIAALSFICCGYNIGNLQHFNWVSGAAWLPWCLWSYVFFLQKCNVYHALQAAFILYLFVASAHPGLSIAMCYFLLTISIFYFVNVVPKHNVRLVPILKSYGLLLVCFLIFATGLIAGYADILPHFSRGVQLNMQASLQQPTTWQSWISVLLPFASTKNNSFFNTDISMRNCYFGLTLLLFFIVAIIKKLTNWQKYFLAVGIFFMLLSLAGVVKFVAHTLLPGIGYVRLNGEFRIFALLSFIIFAAIELNKYKANLYSYSGSVRATTVAFMVIVGLAIGYGIFNAIYKHDSFVFGLQYIFQKPSISLKLKKLIDSISFYDTIWLQGMVQLSMLMLISVCLRRRNFTQLTWVVMAELVLASFFNLPYTGVGKDSVQAVQTVINKSPKGIPIPSLAPLINLPAANPLDDGLVGHPSFYYKQIGTKSYAPYPILLNNTNTYLEACSADTFLPINKYPFVFAGHATPYLFTQNGAEKMAVITIKKYEPNQITLQVNVDTATNIIYQQNYYPHWYYNIGSKKNTVQLAGYNFMQAPIPSGSNEVTFSFEPQLIKWLLLFNLCCIISYLFYWLWCKFK